MANQYLQFISDEHLFSCIQNLHNSYLAAKNNISKRKFYKNKIDTIKLTFDSKFNELDEETLIKAEITRQIDKSINNAIGTFHEEILGGIAGYERGNFSGYDVKATNNTLFADIKNKHNTMNSSAAKGLFLKLIDFANNYPKAKCYWVQIWATGSFHTQWKAKLNGTHYAHDRVYRISGDRFYHLLSGRENALFELYQILPTAIDAFLSKTQKQSQSQLTATSALSEITRDVKNTNRTILDQITFENFSYYLGFDKL